MRSGFSLGRLFGIEVNIDWSWLFIFVLVIWNLSSVFGQFHPSWQAALRWSTAVVAALLFFGSVLAHEFAHSLTARLQGVPVRSITLFLFGGVSNIQRQPESPRAEFLITIVGPITSLALGLVFVVIAGLLSGTVSASLGQATGIIAQLSPLATLLFWLGSVNLLLGAFNMIPGFPLDGGRILRSILWAITDNLRKATRWASYVGQAIAWLMIIGGIAMAFGITIPFFGTGLINGLWLAFIGWFLNSASSQSYQQIVIQDIFEGVPVNRMMRTNAPTVNPDVSVQSLIHDYVMGSDDHAFPVLEGDRLVGMVTLEDVRGVPKDRWEQTHVRAIMTPDENLVTVSPGEDASDALRMLMQRDARQLPVVEGTQLIGLLRRSDIIRWLQLQSDATRSG